MTFLALLLTTALAAPVAHPDIQEVLAAHTQPVEFLKVHNPVSLLGDRALFASAHDPLAANPATSAAGAPLGPATAAQSSTSQGILGRVTGGLLAKRDLSKRAVDISGLYVDGDTSGQLNSNGMAALMRAMPMAKKFATNNPADQTAQSGWTNMKAFANTQGMAT